MNSLPVRPLRVPPLTTVNLPAVTIRQHMTRRPSAADRLMRGRSWPTTSPLAVWGQVWGQIQRLNVWQRGVWRARDSGLPRCDELTGLPNRRALNERLQTLLNAATRGAPTLPGRGQPGWSVLLVDIDSFRALNDAHGHAAGDEALNALTACLRQELRAEDVLGRWGGEEFLVLLPCTGIEGALVAAERLRRAVSLRTFPPVGGLTVSIGAASSLPGDDLERVAARADAGMAVAKQSGRNRVAFSD